MATSTLASDDHGGKARTNKKQLSQAPPTMDQQQPEEVILSEVSSMETGQKTNETKDWERYNTIKKETGQVNRRAYQMFLKDITAEDTTKTCGV